MGFARNFVFQEISLNATANRKEKRGLRGYLHIHAGERFPIIPVSKE
jgi:hypothetical protein